MELTDWCLGRTEHGYRLIGKVKGSKKFDDGEEVHTSRLRKIDFEKMIATTLNSEYELK
jgi:hypothetical protein